MEPKILQADVHFMISKGLQKFLEINFGYRDVESVASCSAVLKRLKHRRHSHLVIDIGLSDGSVLEILPVIRSLYPQTKALVYSAKPYCVYERALQKLGISYLSKQADEPETISCFRHFLDDIEDQRQNVAPHSPFSSLTFRQLEVMHYLLKGKSGVEIAGALNVTRSAISILKSQLFERTGTRSMPELTVLATRYGMPENE